MASLRPKQYKRLLGRLRQARKDAGLSQVQASKALGIPQQFLSRVERGERRIDPAELGAFAELYGKSVSFFLE